MQNFFIDIFPWLAFGSFLLIAFAIIFYGVGHLFLLSWAEWTWGGHFSDWEDSYWRVAILGVFSPLVVVSLISWLPLRVILGRPAP